MLTRTATRSTPPPPHKKAQEEFGISLGLLMGPDLSGIGPIYPVWVSCIFLGVSLSGRLYYVAPLTTLCTTNVSLRSGVSRIPSPCSPVKILGSVHLPISTIHPQLSFWRLAEDTWEGQEETNTSQHIYTLPNLNFTWIISTKQRIKFSNHPVTQCVLRNSCSKQVFNSAIPLRIRDLRHHKPGDACPVHYF